MKIVALVPMKGHSSRVPGKNFKSFLGKPLYAWILETLTSIDQIDQVIINTDAKEQFDHPIAKHERVLFRERRPEICGDEVSMNRILEDDINHIAADVYLMTHSTNPLLSVNTIKSALNAFEEKQHAGQVDSLFTVNKIQTRFYSEDAKAINHDPNNLIPTQDLTPWYEENSNLYLFTRDSFQKTKARIGQRPMIFQSPRLESADIDTPEDWEIAEHIARYLLNKTTR